MIALALGLLVGLAFTLIVLGKRANRRNYSPIGGGNNGRVSPSVQKHHGKAW